MTIHAAVLEQQPEARRRLGRHVVQDSRSVEWDARAVVRPRPLKTTIHQFRAQPWDQGQIGSCTANAMLGCLMSEPLHRETWAFDETTAVDFYKEETRLDDTDIPGHYEPDDTGSSGLWSAKVAKTRGYITAYRHAFHFSTVLQALMTQPVSFGTSWYDSMYEPDHHGFLKVDFSSRLDGGHQVCLGGVDVERESVLVRNSWGTGWGQDGYAWLRWDDLQDLLHDSGDITVPEVAPR
jgi:hypothetical protein